MPSLSRRKAIGFVLVAAGAFATAIPSVAGEPPPLAIKGYDPVAYFTTGGPARGLPELEYEWDEHRYRFSRAEHRALFKANPVRYAPEFTNYCANALTRGELVEADPELWLIREGKLYLFGRPDGPGRFQHDLARNVSRANENRWMVGK